MKKRWSVAVVWAGLAVLPVLAVDEGVLPSGAVWRYDDSGVDQGTAWREPGFNDRAWRSGPAPLGYGGDGEATALSFGPDPQRKPLTCYFRHELVLASTNELGESLTGRMRVDDGAVLYINGRPAWSFLMPVTDTAFDVPAITSSEPESEWREFGIAASWLRAGTNVLAVEVHQSEAKSSDLHFNLEILRRPHFVEPQPGETFDFPVASNVPMRFAWVPRGHIRLGAGKTDEKWNYFIMWPRGFWMGACEVTQAQWDSLMPTNPSVFRGPDLPVDGVTWEQAREFCRRLDAARRALNTALPGVPGEQQATFKVVVDLPTEAHWEYACAPLGGDLLATNAFFNGNTEADLDRVGWYVRNSGDQTHPVGLKEPNAYGLYDTHGNVWEWCLNKKMPYYDMAVQQKDFATAEGDLYGLRGGSWGSAAHGCRTVFRGPHPSVAGGSVGFRVSIIP